MNCHKPVITTKPVGLWKCKKCTSMQNQNAINDNLKANETQEVGNQQSQSNKRTFKSDLNPQSWSAVDVAKYFSSMGYENYASVFINFEIDGTALMLLKRDDVITGRLRIFKEIFRRKNVLIY